MRVDATIPEREGKALARLAKRLGLSRSELVAEAVSYFLRVSDEMASGRLVLVHDPAGGVPPRELVNRALSYVAAPIAQPRAAGGILGQRPSLSADGAWRKELADLGDDFEGRPDRLEPLRGRTEVAPGRREVADPKRRSRSR